MGNNLPTFTLEEVKIHNTLDDCWLVAEGKVYNITEFIKNNSHPAGNKMFERNAGKIVDQDFKFHSHYAKSMWEKYQIGKLKKP